MRWVRDFTFAAVGMWLGAFCMWSWGLAAWPADHPGRTWVTLPRPAGDRVDAEPGDRIPPQKLPTVPTGE